MPATKAAQDQWFAGAVGREMNPDNWAGLQCKDVADDYCQTLFGNWPNTIGAVGNDGAKVSFARANSNYFNKILNDWNNPYLIPERGDIIVYGASRAVPEGHIAVVESADQYGVTVIQQDGYLQKPAFRARLPYVLPNGAVCIGWLRPKLEPPKALASPNQINDVYMQYLERPAEQDAIDHYTRYTIDFVRADLQDSQEYRNLQARKAAEAQANADAEKRRAAEQAEAQRLAEEQAAAERLKRQAEEQARIVEAAKQAAAEAAKVPYPPTLPPLTKPTPPATTASTTTKAQSPLVRFLFVFAKTVLMQLTKKKV